MHPSNNYKVWNPVQIFTWITRCPVLMFSKLKASLKRTIKHQERKKEKQCQILPAHLPFWTAPLFTEINPNQITRSAVEYLNLSICYTNSSSIKLPTASVINECVKCEVAFSAHGHNEGRNTSAARGMYTALVLLWPDAAHLQDHASVLQTSL